MSATFTWKRRRHPAACADNLPLLHELVRLYDDAKLTEANAAGGAGAGTAAAGGSKAGGHSKMASAYGKAIDSLAKYPLQITSAEEAEELQGFGSFLAARVGKLLSKLGVAAAAAPSSLPPSPVVAVGSPSVAPAAAAASKPPRKRKVADEAAAASPAAAAAASCSAAAAASPAAPSPSSRPIPVLPPMSSSSSLSPRIPTSLASALTAVSTPTARAAVASSSFSAAPPACPFGALCYRTNPSHFLEQSHPPDHPVAVVMAESRLPPQQLSRSKSEVIVLSEGSGSPSPPVPRVPAVAAAAASSKPPSAAKRSVAHSFAADADDFMEDDPPAAADDEDDDDDVVDLTSPPAPKMSRAASTPVAASSSAAAKTAAPVLPRPAALPLLHSQSISSLAPVFIPGAAAAASTVPAAKKPKVDKAYRPKANSSAFALLIGLALSKGMPLTKTQVLVAATPFFRNADAAGVAAAAAAPAPDAAAVATSLWSGMANLLTRDLVDKSLTPILYSITSEGMKTAQACAPPGVLPRPSAASMIDALPDDFLSPPPTASAAAASSSSAATAATAPGRAPSASPSPPPAASLRRVFVPSADFEVVLLIDMRERSGRKDSAFIAEKLAKQGMVCETRALAVGDFMWIARQKRPASASAAAAAPPCEVVLDCMIERKRVSDLVSSIRDGRYHEQRSRLKKSGLGRISYLIEGRVAEESCVGLPLSTVESVLVSMAGVHGIMVQHTPSIDASIALLAALHRVVQEEVEAEGVPIITHEGSAAHSKQTLPFGLPLPTISDSSSSATFGGCGESLQSFSARLSKSSNLLAQELFGTQLRQIRGVSAPLAMAILERYPSARSLVEAYEKCTNREEEEEMLHKISRGAYQRPLGKALSLKIRTFFRSLDLDE